MKLGYSASRPTLTFSTAVHATEVHRIGLKIDNSAVWVGYGAEPMNEGQHQGHQRPGGSDQMGCGQRVHMELQVAVSAHPSRHSTPVESLIRRVGGV